MLVECPLPVPWDGLVFLLGCNAPPFSSDLGAVDWTSVWSLSFLFGFAYLAKWWCDWHSLDVVADVSLVGSQLSSPSFLVLWLTLFSWSCQRIISNSIDKLAAFQSMAWLVVQVLLKFCVVGVLKDHSPHIHLVNSLGSRSANLEFKGKWTLAYGYITS